MQRKEGRERIMDIEAEIDEYISGVRCLNALNNNGVYRIKDLLRLSRGELYKYSKTVRNFGRKSLKEIFDFLDENNLKLNGPEEDKYKKHKTNANKFQDAVFNRLSSLENKVDRLLSTIESRVCLGDKTSPNE